MASVNTARPIPGLNDSPRFMRCVYALCDPDAGDVRYIGATTTLRQRYWEHVRNHRATNPALDHWIQGLRDAGKLPTCKILEESTDYTFPPLDQEQAWIRRYPPTGKLLNRVVVKQC